MLFSALPNVHCPLRLLYHLILGCLLCGNNACHHPGSPRQRVRCQRWPQEEKEVGGEGSIGGGRRKYGRKSYGRKRGGGRRKVGEAGLPPSPLSPVYKVFLESTLTETFKQIYKHKHTYTIHNFTCFFLQNYTYMNQLYKGMT